MRQVLNIVEAESAGVSLRGSIRHLYELPGDAHRSRALQGLRGIAVALVFFVHYNTLFAANLTAGSITKVIATFAGHVGHSGVDLFFVLSGFLIYRLVLRPFSYRTFLARRARRLYPAFLTVLAIYTSIAILRPELHKMPADPRTAAVYWVFNAALLPGIFAIVPIITVAWSLSYEFFFYLALPPLSRLFRLSSRTRRTRMLCLGVVSGAAFTLAIFGLLPYIRMLMFVSGMLTAELCARSDAAALVRGWRETIVGVAFLASFPAIFFLSRASTSTGVSWRVSVVATLFVVHAALVMCGYAGRGIVSRVCSVAPLRWLGNISYSFYLAHGLVLNGLALVSHLLVGPGVVTPMFFWLMLPVAWTSAVIGSTILFALVERPWSFVARPAVVPAATSEPASLGVAAL